MSEKISVFPTGVSDFYIDGAHITTWNDDFLLVIDCFVWPFYIVIVLFSFVVFYLLQVLELWKNV